MFTNYVDIISNMLRYLQLGALHTCCWPHESTVSQKDIFAIMSSYNYLWTYHNYVLLTQVSCHTPGGWDSLPLICADCRGMHISAWQVFDTYRNLHVGNYQWGPDSVSDSLLALSYQLLRTGNSDNQKQTLSVFYAQSTITVISGWQKLDWPVPGSSRCKQSYRNTYLT